MIEEKADLVSWCHHKNKPLKVCLSCLEDAREEVLDKLKEEFRSHEDEGHPLMITLFEIIEKLKSGERGGECLGMSVVDKPALPSTSDLVNSTDTKGLQHSDATKESQNEQGNTRHNFPAPAKRLSETELNRLYDMTFEMQKIMRCMDD